jgi:hypothetical protein
MHPDPRDTALAEAVAAAIRGMVLAPDGLALAAAMGALVEALSRIAAPCPSQRPTRRCAAPLPCAGSG